MSNQNEDKASVKGREGHIPAFSTPYLNTTAVYFAWGLNP